MALYNYHQFDYPKEKIEWIVVDDSDDPTKTIEHYPSYITVIRPASHLTIGAKRNMGCQKASHPYILMMDDDDIYYPESIKNRVYYLMKGHCKIIGCNYIMHFNLKSSKGSYASDGIRVLSEASLGITKQFWEERPFDNRMAGEGQLLVRGREDQVLVIPPIYIFCAVNHGSNITQDRVNDDHAKEDFISLWNAPLQQFIAQYKEFIDKSDAM
jgi:glycosyltransferase involved in cell wall biosynthesis